MLLYNDKLLNNLCDIHFFFFLYLKFDKKFFLAWKYH